MKKLLTLLSCLLVIAESAFAIFPMKLRNGSDFADSEIYIAIVGQSYANNGGYIYYDLKNNSSTNVKLNTLNESVNTLHKTSGDWGYSVNKGGTTANISRYYGNELEVTIPSTIERATPAPTERRTILCSRRQKCLRYFYLCI